MDIWRVRERDRESGPQVEREVGKGRKREGQKERKTEREMGGTEREIDRQTDIQTCGG